MGLAWIYIAGASLVAQRVKRLPAMQETWVQSLGQEDPLKKEMTIHSSTVAWKIPWIEKPGRLQSMGSQRVGHDWATSLHFHVLSTYSRLKSSLYQIYRQYFIKSQIFSHLPKFIFLDIFLKFQLVNVFSKNSLMELDIELMENRDIG